MTEVRVVVPRTRRVLQLFLVLCLSISLALAASPSTATARPPSDDFEGLVDVGGHRLYVKCMGRGGPTVILEAALANTSATWDLVQPEVARFTTVCSYDRANLGKSDRAPVPRTSQTSVDELRALLQNAGIRGPYVLVGHSYWGLDRPALSSPGRGQDDYRRGAGRCHSDRLAAGDRPLRTGHSDPRADARGGGSASQQ